MSLDDSVEKLKKKLSLTVEEVVLISITVRRSPEAFQINNMAALEGALEDCTTCIGSLKYLFTSMYKDKKFLMSISPKQ